MTKNPYENAIMRIWYLLRPDGAKRGYLDIDAVQGCLRAAGLDPEEIPLPTIKCSRCEEAVEDNNQVAMCKKCYKNGEVNVQFFFDW